MFFSTLQKICIIDMNTILFLHHTNNKMIVYDIEGEWYGLFSVARRVRGPYTYMPLSVKPLLLKALSGQPGLASALQTMATDHPDALLHMLQGIQNDAARTLAMNLPQQ